MKKFVVLYHASQEALDSMKDKDPEEMKKGMEIWRAWAEKCGSSLVDIGTPLGISAFVGGEGSSTICGYSLVQAEDMEGAKALFDGHPHLGWAPGCTIEVMECMPMPDE